MSPPVLAILAAALALLASAPAARAQDDEAWAVEQARRDKEATVLFATIVKDLPVPRRPAEIHAEWSQYAEAPGRKATRARAGPALEGTAAGHPRLESRSVE